MRNLESMVRSEQEKYLRTLTINKIIKPGLLSAYPTIIESLNFSKSQSDITFAAINHDLEYNPEAKKEYLFSPIDIETLRQTSLESPTLGDLIRLEIQEKYASAGELLAFIALKFNQGLNKGFSSYYLCVSNELDLLRALVEISSSLGEKLDIPVLKGKNAENDPRRQTHLVEGTQAYCFYRRLQGDTSIPETELEKLLREYPLDAVVTVTPNLNQTGIPVMIFRRKSPSSIGDKYAYSVIGQLMMTAYKNVPSLQRRKAPETRIKKYSKYSKVGVEDIHGVGVLYPGYQNFPAHLQQAGLGSLIVEKEDDDPKPVTGEEHWDLELSEFMKGSPLQTLGGIEVHAFSSSMNYLFAQLAGDSPHTFFKASRIRELVQAHPNKDNSAVREAWSYIKSQVIGTFMPNIRLAYYPGKFYIVNPSGIALPTFKLLSQCQEERSLDGRYSLFNEF